MQESATTLVPGTEKPEQPAPAKRSTGRKILTLVLLGVLGGGVVAGATLPVSATIGVTAKLAGESFEDLPKDLQMPPTPQASYLYASDGKTVITQFWEENRTDVGSDDIAKVMKDAIVAAEDTRFYEHGGVDVKGLVRAFVSNAQGGQLSGASTLTMQYVRNVLKNDQTASDEEREAATELSTSRKLQEIRYAVTIEDTLEKEEILRRYLNIAYFGNKSYGVAAAARAYFSTTPDKLTLSQAATIAGLVKSPDQFDPVNNDPGEAQGRRDYVLNAMVGTGAITREEADKAIAEPLNLKPTQATSNCTAVPEDHNNWGFFCDYFVSWWKAQEEFGPTPEDREDSLKKGGFRIVTSLDPKLQDAATAQALSIYDVDNPRAAPIAIVQPGTGKVQALAINRRFSIVPNPNGGNYPNTVNQFIAGSEDSAGMQWGSTFKLFVMLAALENGFPLDTGYNTKGPMKTIYPDGGPDACGGFWCPSNASASYQDGYQNMWTGFGKSSNTFFIRLQQEVGVDKAVEMAKRLGIQFRNQKDAELAANPSGWGSFTLGVAATTPLDMANAYATLAADGKYCKPTPVVSITDSTGAASAAAAKVAQPECTQAIKPDVARAAADAGRCVVGQQPSYGQCADGTSTAVSGIVGRPVSGKSGTADAYATVSFIGVTPQLAIAGIAANPDNPTDLVGQQPQDDVVRAVATLLRDGLKGQPVKDFPAPSQAIAFKSGSASSPQLPPASPPASPRAGEDDDD
ncbi:transglycosylase domain-containing protein [Catenuloplanes atrovinosus]|uniref:Membrane peptidoglycan carboxypeptidase n=1 Tax=Catenuloplanes atrovinosus TaxID=137266 RepID=A0AAE4CDB3_9ACTN|nr:transglycosylase domain-containing protein [Catenuloplanes atrovinosus]MDR7277350.1 membrane peptidoglycan carboxypeptidase [Catenuloplanes atrovinosus]